MGNWWIFVIVLAATLVLALTWRRLRTFGGQVWVERAREMFKLQRQPLEAQFHRAAAASGKPRGLRWVACQWGDAVEFVRDRQTGLLAALVAVTIQFEAVEGGDMEGVAAVGNLRNASGVFFFQAGQWSTVGRAIFNMNPDEAAVHFSKQYEKVL
jgi:hypothetical protein